MGRKEKEERIEQDRREGGREGTERERERLCPAVPLPLFSPLSTQRSSL